MKKNGLKFNFYLIGYLVVFLLLWGLFLGPIFSQDSSKAAHMNLESEFQK